MPVVDQSFDLLLDRLAQTLGAAAVELRVATPFAGDATVGRVGNAPFAGLSRSTNEID